LIDLFAEKSIVPKAIWYSYLALIVFSIFRELSKIYRDKLSYFKQFWSLIQLLIIIFSLISFTISTYRTYFGEKLLNSFLELHSNSTNNSNVNIANKDEQIVYFPSFKYLSFWNKIFQMLLAFCPTLATLKFIKLIRFNKIVLLLIASIKSGLVSLVGIVFIFVILFASYIQIFYLIFKDKLYEYSNLVISMESCFKMMLGKFDLSAVIQANPFFGLLLFISFNVCMILITMNLIISSLSDTFELIKNNPSQYLEGNELAAYLSDAVSASLLNLKAKFAKIFIKRTQLPLEELSFDNKENYWTSIDSNLNGFMANTNKLIHRLDWVFLNLLYLKLIASYFNLIILKSIWSSMNKLK
jgi:polycystin 2